MLTLYAHPQPHTNAYNCLQLEAFKSGCSSFIIGTSACEHSVIIYNLAPPFGVKIYATATSLN